MAASDLIGRSHQLLATGLGTLLVTHAAFAPSTAGVIGQLVAGAALIIASMLLHAARLWIDKKVPTLAPLVDMIDGQVAADPTVQHQVQALQSTMITSTPSPAPTGKAPPPVDSHF
jgi:hypothetical protein